MTETTPLDRAHIAMDQNPDEDALRLIFYERLADCELFMLLKAEALGETMEPEVFEVEGGSFVLVFDREDRLAEFVGQSAPFAALSGRAIAGLIAGQGIGLGVNLGVAPSSILIPEEAVNWLNGVLGNGPSEAEGRPTEVNAPKGLPDSLIGALDTKLALAAGMARSAYLVAVTYEGNRKSHLLAFVDAAHAAEGALAQATSEALIFSGIEAGEIDVAFFDASDPICASFAKVGLRFELPKLEGVSAQAPTGPGMDPSKPPILR